MSEKIQFVDTRINGKWNLLLPEFRAKRFRDWEKWEKERLESMFLHIKKGDIVYEIGAEEGDFAALCQKWVGDNGGVVLFEPQPLIWPNIKAIFENNELKNPLAYYVGFASNSTEENPPNLNFDAKDKQGWPLCAYGELKPDRGFRHLAQEIDATPQIKLDDFYKRTYLIPDVMSIDVEGSEFHVLMGAERILSKYKPMIFVSVHESLKVMYDQTEDDIDNFMYKLGYEKEHIATDHEKHIRYFCD